MFFGIIGPSLFSLGPLSKEWPDKNRRKSEVTLSKACHVRFQHDFSSKTPQCKPKGITPNHFGPIRD